MVLWLSLLLLPPLVFADSGDCYDAVHELAPHDALLQSRLDLKLGLTANGTVSLDNFVAAVTHAPANGTFFGCGYTRNYVTEVFLGLEASYAELIGAGGDPSGEGAGFANLLGEDLVALFDVHTNSTSTVLYELALTGAADHVWLVEQRPGPTFRVYQSYFEAHSLRAWLADEAELPSLFDTGDFLLLRRAKDIMDGILAKAGCSADALEDCPLWLSPFRPWIRELHSYDRAAMLGNFLPAWRSFGAGQTLGGEEFHATYLRPLAALTVALQRFPGTLWPWTREVHEAWIALFASPHPLAYPGVPFGIVAYAAGLPAHINMMAKAAVVPSASLGSACARHAGIIRQSLPEGVSWV